MLLILGIFICAGKFILNLLTPGSALHKDISLIPEIRRQAAADPLIRDAWNRWHSPGRPWHDLTNIPIEYFRFITRTWELQNSTQIISGVVKFLSFLFVFLLLLIVVLAFLVAAAS